MADLSHILSEPASEEREDLVSEFKAGKTDARLETELTK